ncbi:MAG: peptidylprolyl isomerase [Sedimentisphaerales bacterium]|nr:peptidylprolyl isomerase [Sedimentisphaerales bacterium]
MTLYINGQSVDPQNIEEEVARLRPEYERVFADMEQDDRETQLADWARENVIEGILLQQEAMRHKSLIASQDIDDAMKSMIDRHGGHDGFACFLTDQKLTEQQVRSDIEKQIRMQRLLEKIESQAKEPTDKQIRKFYEDNQTQFMLPPMMRAAHIVKHPGPNLDREQLKADLLAVLEKLHQGEDFSKLAQEYSDCPDRGGDLGWFSPGQMVEAFEDVVKKLRPGEISDVFETEFGFHIAKLIDIRPSAAIDLDQVRGFISEELHRQFRQKTVEHFIDELKSRAVIEDR